MIKIQFDFPHRRIQDLQQLNELLQTMELAGLSIEESQGYLATITDAEGHILHRRYGLDSGTLRCQLAEYGPGYRYRIDTYVVSHIIDPDTYLARWRELHPDREFRIGMLVGFGNMLTYTIVHHEKVEAP